MRVLLISANQEQSPDPVAPLGVCYVATAAAAAGHDVEVLDLCFVSDVEHAAREDPASLPGVASWTPGAGVRRNPPAWLPSPDAVTASRRWIDNQRYLECGGMAN